MPADQLPEGTDTIIEGAGVGPDDVADADAIDDAAAAMTVSTPPGDAAPEKRASAEPVSLTDRVEALKGQANDRAREFVQGIKDRATGGIDEFVQMINDAADEVEAKVGSHYGDYVRRAADGVAGITQGIKDKDVDALFDDGRAFLARSPGVAVGVAAAIGFVVARLARAGVAEAAEAAEPAGTAKSGKAA